MAAKPRSLMQVYGIYIVLIIAIAGLAVLLFDANLPVSLAREKARVSTCAPDDPSCVSGTPSVERDVGTREKERPDSGDGAGASVSGEAGGEAEYSPLVSCPGGISGSGSVGSPCIITTCEQLQAMNQGLSLSYALDRDIDCSNTSVSGASIWGAKGLIL